MIPETNKDRGYSVDGYRLSSGRFIYAYAQIIGISPKLIITDGYDGTISFPDPIEDAPFEPGDDLPWTNEEKIELADYMIGLWQQFKDSVK